MRTRLLALATIAILGQAPNGYSTTTGRPSVPKPATPRIQLVPFMAETNDGSILSGMIWMIIVSILLFWLPVVGPLVAGFVGGKKAGGIGAGIIAAILPSLALGAVFFLFATMFSGIPVIGIVAGAGALTFALSGIGPLLLGAVIGGVFA